MASSINPFQDIPLSSSDVSVLKANEVEGVIVLRVTLPEQSESSVLAGRKAVVLKWTKKASLELKIHKLLTGKSEFITLLYGAEGSFSLETLFPKMGANSITKLKQVINSVGTVLNKRNTFKVPTNQCVLVMEAMDDSLEGKLPYFSIEARKYLEQPVARILQKAIETLQKEGLCHGDFQLRNIFIKEVKAGTFRVKCGDFGASGPLRASNRDSLEHIFSTFNAANYCRKTKNSNSRPEITGSVTVLEGPSPKKALPAAPRIRTIPQFQLL